MSSYHSQEQTLAQLPQPGVSEIEHSSELIEFIVGEIEQHGVLPFSAYMNMALYQPGLGYYSAGSTKFGASGDFTTAPEISPLFGHCLARQCESIFSQGCAHHLLEFGAGSGRLCAQILSSLSDPVSYSIVEISADLRARQQLYLQDNLPPALFKQVQWLDKLPENFDGILFGNEVLDAMPVSVVVKDQQWQELGVGYDGERLIWQHLTGQSDAVSAIQVIEKEVGVLAEGYCTEVNLNFKPWLEALQACCHQAVILMIDYGYEQSQYYHPQRTSGTLTCHYRHRAHPDPFVYPGLQDITAFVDFDAFADAALCAGFSVSGLTSQRQFLLHNGLLDEAQLLDQSHDTRAQIELAQQIKTLTLPGEMGEKFKVIGLQKNLSIDIPALAGGR
ncbi:MAG: SAM-dependent MidA family methyltransferase [Gammaproteobacteria bacterium]|jgi:SAM-dependent MidA family methyltransferase